MQVAESTTILLLCYIRLYTLWKKKTIAMRQVHEDLVLLMELVTGRSYLPRILQKCLMTHQQSGPLYSIIPQPYQQGR